MRWFFYSNLPLIEMILLYIFSAIITNTVCILKTLEISHNSCPKNYPFVFFSHTFVVSVWFWIWVFVCCFSCERTKFRSFKLSSNVNCKSSICILGIVRYFCFAFDFVLFCFLLSSPVATVLHSIANKLEMNQVLRQSSVNSIRSPNVFATGFRCGICVYFQLCCYLFIECLWSSAYLSLSYSSVSLFLLRSDWIEYRSYVCTTIST